MTVLRFFGAVFLIIVILGFTMHLSGAVIASLFFFGGCAAIVIGIIARAISRHW